MNVEAVLAKKYATAFLNVAGEHFTNDELARMDKLRVFLQNAHDLLFFFNLPLISTEALDEVVSTICSGFATEHLLKKLMHLVAEERRAFLLPDIVEYIASLYRKRNNRLLFAIKSTQELSSGDKDTLKQFLAGRTQSTIDTTYEIDHTLIAGARALSDSLLWEHSVKQRLMALQQSLIEQGV